LPFKSVRGYRHTRYPRHRTPPGVCRAESSSERSQTSSARGQFPLATVPEHQALPAAAQFRKELCRWTSGRALSNPRTNWMRPKTLNSVRRRTAEPAGVGELKVRKDERQKKDKKEGLCEIQFLLHESEHSKRTQVNAARRIHLSQVKRKMTIPGTEPALIARVSLISRRVKISSRVAKNFPMNDLLTSLIVC
jgi:hypothetical protein